MKSIKTALKKVLVIRFSSIGDIVLCSPVFRTLKLQKNVEVHWLTKKNNAFINAHNPYIDKIHCYDNNYKTILKGLQSEKFDLVIDLHKNLRSFRFRSQLKCPSFDFNKINIQKYILVNFQIDLIGEPRHLVDRYFKSLERIGIVNDEQGLDYFYGEETKNPITTYPYIVYGIGGTYNTKKMPTDEIIRHFGNLPYPLVLLGGKTEEAAAAEIESALGDKVINMVNQCNLHTSAKIIEEGQFLISHDTATMHIGAALNQKILSVWGATAPPLGMTPYLPPQLLHQTIALDHSSLKCHPCSKLGGDQCPKGHFKCLRDLPSEMVNPLIEEMLKK
ncbi:glycosyltransferase family 9 protein [Membranihabitans marinus]|uniref:glycosyltransferase family 9 protein n=1 Tax=Membranihabitans marinus TaxID=1227546 RepID=UPI001F300C68|nr:glycosyltransferase family 9 protein [Membranihabitans marinus]